MIKTSAKKATARIRGLKISRGMETPLTSPIKKEMIKATAAMIPLNLKLNKLCLP